MSMRNSAINDRPEPRVTDINIERERPRCGETQPARALVGGLCPSCVAGSVKEDRLRSCRLAEKKKEPLLGGRSGL